MRLGKRQKSPNLQPQVSPPAALTHLLIPSKVAFRSSPCSNLQLPIVKRASKRQR